MLRRKKAEEKQTSPESSARKKSASQRIGFQAAGKRVHWTHKNSITTNPCLIFFIWTMLKLFNCTFFCTMFDEIIFLYLVIILKYCTFKKEIQNRAIPIILCPAGKVSWDFRPLLFWLKTLEFSKMIDLKVRISHVRVVVDCCTLSLL